MFNFTKTPRAHDVALDEAISDLLMDLKGGVGNEEEQAAHTVATDNLSKLMKLKQELNPSWRPSPDAIVGAGASLLGILLILNYEKAGNFITTKALSFIGKAMK